MKIAVIGIGNILFQDEGAGVYAATYLAKNYSFAPAIEIIDGGTLGFKLMRYYQEYDKIIIIDTVSIEDAPGSIYNLPSDALMGLGSYRKTAHEVEVVEMLEICSLLESMARVHVVGIVPEDIESVGIGLTKSMHDNFQNLIDEVLEELKKDSVVPHLHNNISLDEIILNYANPSMAEA